MSTIFTNTTAMPRIALPISAASRCTQENSALLQHTGYGLGVATAVVRVRPVNEPVMGSVDADAKGAFPGLPAWSPPN